MKNFYRDSGLVVSISALVLMLVVLAAIIYSENTSIFWIIAPFLVLVGGFTIGKLITVTRKTFQYYSYITGEIIFENKNSLYEFPLAVVIIDSNRQLIWFNQNFKDEFEDAADYGKSLNYITEISVDSLIEAKNTHIKYKNKDYIVSINGPRENENSDDKSEIIVLYFNNITEKVRLETEKKLSHPVMVIVMIDNYDEMFEGTPESEKAHVTVKIDKLLEDYISSTTGIMKKFNRDRLWLVMESRHVDKLIENKVDLLDKAREITVTDRVNVTLSIGIGTTAENLAESELFARQALDMALGRGGDQAAVKTANGFEFYGGVSKGIERQTKVKARIIANSLIELINTSDSVYIMGHKFSDLDCLGASIGLSFAVRNLGKPAYCVVDKTASLGQELIERIRASEDDKNSIFIQPQKAREMFRENSLLIIVDTHNINLLEDFELYHNAAKVVVIDHHRKMVNYIDNALIFHHEPYASSACEMVSEILGYFGKAGKITALQAEAVLSGIMLDTKNFTIKTGVRTFEAAASLRKLGADTINVKSLFSNSFENYKQKVLLVADAKIHKRCAIATAEHFTDSMRLVAPQAADELLSIVSVDASFVIYEAVPNEVYLSARSLGALNVQLIMEAIGGGGHQTMAGAQIKDISVREAEELLIKTIDNYFESLNKNR